MLYRLIRVTCLICLVWIPVLKVSTVQADINPWVVSRLYDPTKWDTAGPYTATPWLHPPTSVPDQAWGAFSGKWRTTGALTGSWGGLRDELVERGIQLEAAYVGQFAANPIGGESQGESWKGSLGIALFFDLERLVRWKRGYLTASFAYVNPGNSLSSDHIGNQFPVQLSSGDDNGATRLVHLAFGQQLFDNKVELVLGRMIAGEDFATLRLACTSVNQAICGNPIAAAQSISFPTYPSATWGARIMTKPGTGWYAQLGSYLVFEDFRDAGFHGVNFSAPDGSGALTLAEAGFIVGHYRGVQGLPGKYKAGGYFDTEQLEDLATGNEVHGTWGVYVMGEQMFYAEDKNYSEGLSGFLALSYAPEDRNIISFMAAGGLSYQGLLAGRSQDALSLVAAYGRYSNDLARSDREADEPIQDFETLFEINYRAQIAPWLYVQPDLQFIIHPDGRSDIENAFVLGFTLGLVF
jgi:porin